MFNIFLARSYLHNLFVQLAFFQLVFPSKSCSFNRQSINWFSAKMHFWQTVLRWKWVRSKGSSAYKFSVKVFRGKCFRSTGFRYKLVEPVYTRTYSLHSAFQLWVLCILNLKALNLLLRKYLHGKKVSHSNVSQS